MSGFFAFVVTMRNFRSAAKARSTAADCAPVNDLDKS